MKSAGKQRKTEVDIPPAVIEIDRSEQFEENLRDIYILKEESDEAD